MAKPGVSKGKIPGTIKRSFAFADRPRMVMDFGKYLTTDASFPFSKKECKHKRVTYVVGLSVKVFCKHCGEAWMTIEDFKKERENGKNKK